MKLKTIIAILFCAILTISGFSQQAYIDSLERLLPQKMTDEMRAEIFFKLAKSYRNVNAYIGLDYIDSSLRMVQKTGDRLLRAEIVNETGVLYRKLSLFKEALDEHQKALTEFETLHDSMGIAFTFANFGNVFLAIGQLDKALEYNLKSLKVKKQLGDTLQIAYSLRTTAIACQALHKYDSALVLLNEALEIYTRAGAEYNLANIYYHLGSVNLESEKSQSMALVYFGKALKIFNSLESLYGSSLAKYQAGKVYFQLGEYDTAESLYAEALEIATKAKTPKLVMDINHDLAELNKKTRKFYKALNYYNNYSSLRDSLYSENFSKNIVEMQAKYKNDQQQNEILLLRNENKLIRNEHQLKFAYFIMLILAVVFALILVALLLWRNREKKKLNIHLQKEILDRKANEQKLIESEIKLTEANAAKDKFFSIISHDLKSPFGAMKGLLEILESSYHELNENEKQQIIKQVNKAAANTYALLEGLLAWSQAQRGTIDFDPLKAPLDQYCAGTIENLMPAANKKQVTIKNTVVDSILVNADLNMLTTIIRNLVSNAIKFTPQGGEVIVSAQQTQDDIIEISVSDNGMGIKADDLCKIFKIEEKFNTRGTDNETGTGLGLLICKEFVEKHKGMIWVESEEGKGSTFTFTLPAG